MTGSEGGLLLRNARCGLAARPTDLLIAGGRVVEAPRRGTVRPSETVDLDGRTVLPGLWDAHVHSVQWAQSQRRVDVSAARSAAEAARIIARAVAAGGAPDGPLLAHGFRDALWSDAPHRALLDAVAAGRPVVAVSHDLHTAWLNTAALAVAGHPDHPTGVLRDSECYAALDRFPTDTAQTDADVLDTLRAAAARGVVGIVDFEYADNVADWRRRAAAGPLPVRVEASIPAGHLDEAVRRGLRTGDPVPGTGGLVTVGPVKAFVDGSLNTRTALCSHPYPGSDSYGHLDTGPDELDEIVTTCVRQGLLPALHAIGDRAVSLALDALERAQSPGRIEHAQLVSPVDLPRFGRPGVVAGVQPAHLLDDRDAADRHWAGRTSEAFCYASLQRAGALLEMGSDAPVSPLDPWLGIAAAVARSLADRPPWHPEQAMTLDDALVAACRGRRGVQVGEPADLVIVDGEPAAAAGAALAGTPVFGTLLAGRWTYRAAPT